MACQSHAVRCSTVDANDLQVGNFVRGRSYASPGERTLSAIGNAGKAKYRAVAVLSSVALFALMEPIVLLTCGSAPAIAQRT